MSNETPLRARSAPYSLTSASMTTCVAGCVCTVIRRHLQRSEGGHLKVAATKNRQRGCIVAGVDVEILQPSSSDGFRLTSLWHSGDWCLRGHGVTRKSAPPRPRHERGKKAASTKP